MFLADLVGLENKTIDNILFICYNVLLKLCLRFPTYIYSDECKSMAAHS